MIWNRFLGLLYPSICVLCGYPAGEGLCSECDRRIQWYRGEGCRACGAGVFPVLCPACFRRKMSFRTAVALGSYSGLLRRMILAMKLRGEPSLVRLLTSRLAVRVRESAVRVDVITFVPSGLFRGFSLRHPNITEVVAHELGRHLRKPVRPCLRKTRRTIRQTRLGGEERWGNMKGAFVAGKGVEDRSVLLVDDVLTTGATASACTDAMYHARAREVHVSVLARRLRIQI